MAGPVYTDRPRMSKQEASDYFRQTMLTKKAKQAGLPTEEATESAEYAKKRLALANKYGNKKSRDRAEAKFGKKAKERRKIKYVMKNGRLIREDSQA